ncbi:amidase signature domain-containing protein [Schizophyllum amplum]|uniref:Amidase signature domain-containing protein n=1 Tax=Schizophyllum amplum TaxID=97359 RepID=A0A550CH36_9AGAR|nr:amidase signature domain-containing protein [Auriculariopsis ampla]
MKCLSITAATLALGASCASAWLTSTTLEYADVSYFVPHLPVTSFTGDLPAAKEAGLVPFTVVQAANSTLSSDYVQSQLSVYASSDDVFSDYFTDVLYIQSLCDGTTLDGTLDATVFLSQDLSSTDILAPGPYFLSATSGDVYKAYRLYPDTQSAFTEGLVPYTDDSFHSVHAAAFTGQAEVAVPVPSRLYSIGDDRPLAGLRFAVKDIYHVKGVRTGAASRAFYSLYPERNESAPAVQRILDMGGELVGKAKTSQFANGENPTADWIEVLAPFNPRGDGWQYCSSSSAGSAVSVASYDWIDHAIGTDTSGSMRFPAAYNGVFGARPSHDAITTDGVVPCTPKFDTAGVFARDAKAQKKFAHAWYGEDRFTEYPSLPKKILRAVNSTIGGFPVASNASQDIYDGFIDQLQAYLGADVEDFDASKEWLSSGPSEEELLVYTNMSYLAIAWYDQVQLVQVPFFADWAAKYNGSIPPINPKSRASFSYGNNNVTDASYAEALAIRANFTNWWNTAVNPTNNDTCADSIYVYPAGTAGAPRYRDTYFLQPSVVVNWQISHAAVYGGLPDFVVPLGQVEYASEKTGVNETLPVSISIGSAQGCDWMLYDLLEGLENAGIIGPVKTGKMAF